MNKLKKIIVLITLLSISLLVGCGSKSYTAILNSSNFFGDSEFDTQIMEAASKDKVVTLDINQLKDNTELVVNIKFTATLPTQYELTTERSSLIWLYDTSNYNNEVYFDKDTVEINNGSGFAQVGDVVNITYKGMLERKLTNDEIKEITQMTIYFDNFGGGQAPLVCDISEIK